MQWLTVRIGGVTYNRVRPIIDETRYFNTGRQNHLHLPQSLWQCVHVYDKHCVAPHRIPAVEWRLPSEQRRQQQGGQLLWSPWQCRHPSCSRPGDGWVQTLPGLWCWLTPGWDRHVSIVLTTIAVPNGSGKTRRTIMNSRAECKQTRQADRQTDRQTEKQTDRQADARCALADPTPRLANRNKAIQRRDSLWKTVPLYTL